VYVDILFEVKLIDIVRNVPNIYQIQECFKRIKNYKEEDVNVVEDYLEIK